MQNKRNAFSDNLPEVSVLVHTQDFIKDNGALQYLRNANKIKGIKVYFMPVLSTNTTLSLETGKYTHFKDGLITSVVLDFADCGCVVSMHSDISVNIDDKEIYRLAEKSIINGELVTDLFDYVVVRTNFANKEKCNVPVVSLEQCKEILRLFLVHRKQFWVSGHYCIDETFYYIYRHKKLFSEFQNYWSAVCESGEIDDWSDALDNRLKLMTICLDQCKIEAYKAQNNTTVMYLKYYLSYLMLLITGTFDNLAWIINNKYSLKLDRMKIDLKGKKFKESIKDKSDSIYTILTEKKTEAVIAAIRELRDRIVHREFIKVGRGGNVNSKNETSYLYLDTEAYDLLEEAGFSRVGIEFKTEDEVFIYMHEFIDFLERSTVDFVNALVKIIADEIYDARDTYEIWKLLELAVEPYVL